jgi:hypothetical protein
LNPWDEVYRAEQYPSYAAMYGRPAYPLKLFIAMALVARDAEAAAIGRKAQGNRVFGERIDDCPGAPLARMEGAIAAGAMIARRSELRLAAQESPSKYKGSYFPGGIAAPPMIAR